ncbi:MAG: PEP-CTERM sorting domain-containing protein, partial [Planctomycetota bacterium]
GIFLDKSDPTTGNFDTYTSVGLAGLSGTTLDIRVSWAGTPSGGEPIGFDNFTVNGSIAAIPEPGSMALVGLVGLGGAFGGWRRRKAAVTA